MLVGVGEYRCWWVLEVGVYDVFGDEENMGVGGCWRRVCTMCLEIKRIWVLVGVGGGCVRCVWR